MVARSPEEFVQQHVGGAGPAKDIEASLARVQTDRAKSAAIRDVDMTDAIGVGRQAIPYADVREDPLRGDRQDKRP